jgi:hypothetical protein
MASLVAKVVVGELHPVSPRLWRADEISRKFSVDAVPLLQMTETLGDK